MADRWAVASGNWSNTATWNGGTLPTSADDVYSNTFTVDINQNVTVLSLRNTSTTGVTAGGGFTVTTGVTVTTTAAQGFIPHTGLTLITVTNPAGTTANLNGTSTTSSTTGTVIAANQGGTLNITGNFQPNNDTAVSITGVGASETTSILNIIGNLTANSNNNSALRVTSASTRFKEINIIGNISKTGGGQNQHVVSISTGASVLIPLITITGTLTANSSGSTFPVNVFSSATIVRVNGALVANVTRAISSNSVTNVYTGPFICGPTGVLPTLDTFRLNPIVNNEFRFATENVGVTSSLYSSDVTSGAPATNNVRAGTVYANGLLTGTLAVPNPAYVALGVSTDNTVGTLAYNSDTAIADALWNKQTSALTTAGSIGERLKNASTVDTTGAQIASFGGA